MNVSEPGSSGIGHFDRDAATRLSEAALDAAWAEPGTRLLRLREGLLPVRRSGSAAELALLPVPGERGEAHWYLGRVGGRALFAMEQREDDGAAESDGEWQHPFQCGGRLSPVQQEVMMVALALANWHRTMPFSPRDGEPTTPSQGGWARVDSRGGEHFPRTDPAVIVAVEHENRLLLGSNVLWETGRFSLLAGFVEAGESAEQCVAREIFEEAGVLVDEVRYMGSQGWPFPRSLMLGFRARLADGVDPRALVPDASEISELRWFSRTELLDRGSGLKLPGRLSIARRLIDQWVAEGELESGGDSSGDDRGR